MYAIRSYYEALYIGRGVKDVKFASVDKSNPAKFYLSSTPAHKAYPVTLVNKETANILNLGAKETCNERTIYQLIVPGIVESCQLVMGITELNRITSYNVCYTKLLRNTFGVTDCI